VLYRVQRPLLQRVAPAFGLSSTGRSWRSSATSGGLRASSTASCGWRCPRRGARSRSTAPGGDLTARCCKSRYTVLQVQVYKSRYTSPGVQVQVYKSRYTVLQVQVYKSRYTSPGIQVQVYKSRYTMLQVQVYKSRYTSPGIQVQVYYVIYNNNKLIKKARRYRL